jgi:hypothetical protein
MSDKTTIKRELVALDPIDKLVSVQLDTTLNTLKLLYGFVLAMQFGIDKGEFHAALGGACKTMPILESLFKRCITGFQIHNETKQTLQFVIGPVDPDRPEDEDPNNIDKIMETILTTHGNA